MHPIASSINTTNMCLFLMQMHLACNAFTSIGPQKMGEMKHYTNYINKTKVSNKFCLNWNCSVVHRSSLILFSFILIFTRHFFQRFPIGFGHEESKDESKSTNSTQYHE